MEQRTLHSITTRGRAVVDFVALAAVVALLVSAILALAVAIVPAAEPRPAAPPPPGAGGAGASRQCSRGRPPAPDSLRRDRRPEVSSNWRSAIGCIPVERSPGSPPQREFPIGDTENSGKVVRFLPSFMIVDGKPRSESAAMNNPAVRIMVYFKGTPNDSSWAFLNFPPHFSPKSFYTFQLKSITGYPRTAAATAPAAGNPPPPAKPPGKDKPASKSKASNAGAK